MTAAVRVGARAWSLGRRLTVALAMGSLIILLLVASAGVLLSQLRTSQQRLVQDRFEAYTLSNQLFTTLVEAESALRGYALTADRSFVVAYRRAPDRLASDYDRVLDLVADSPRLVTGLRAVNSAAERWVDEWATPTVERVSARGRGAISTADLLRGRELFDRVRGHHETYEEALLAERRQALGRLSALTSDLVGVLAFGLLAAAGVGIALWITVRRWVIRPVTELAAETRTVSAGRLDYVVTVQGPPEFVELARDVDLMRRGLLTQLSILQAAKDEVEQTRSRLEAQATELQRSNEELEQFAYVASHDLQEPLRKVASFCQMLQRRYQGQLDARADQYIAFAVEGAKRMQQLINDLLAFSRVGRITTNWADVRLEAALAQALRNLAAAVEESGAEVTWDPLPIVRGEAGLLTQLFQNLVGNGIKFRGEDPPQIHVGVERVGDEWEFSCADNGMGIEPRYADRIFVIFQRLHAKDRYDGTGIGLAMCKKIVEYHGGRIFLDTEVSSGTTFRFTLPVPQNAGGAGDEREAAEDPSPGTVPVEGRVEADRGASDG